MGAKREGALDHPVFERAGQHRAGRAARTMLTRIDGDQTAEQHERDGASFTPVTIEATTTIATGSNGSTGAITAICSRRRSTDTVSRDVQRAEAAVDDQQMPERADRQVGVLGRPARSAHVIGRQGREKPTRQMPETTRAGSAAQGHPRIWPARDGDDGRAERHPEDRLQSTEVVGCGGYPEVVCQRAESEAAASASSLVRSRVRRSCCGIGSPSSAAIENGTASRCPRSPAGWAGSAPCQIEGYSALTSQAVSAMGATASSSQLRR